MIKYSTWVYEDNLQLTVKGLAFIGSYHFDSSDWAAITYGIKNIARQKDEWFHYPLIGEIRIDLSITQDSGTSVYEIKVAAERDILDQIKLLEYFAQSVDFTGS